MNYISISAVYLSFAHFSLFLIHNDKFERDNNMASLIRFWLTDLILFCDWEANLVLIDRFDLYSAIEKLIWFCSDIGLAMCDYNWHVIRLIRCIHTSMEHGSAALVSVAFSSVAYSWTSGGSIVARLTTAHGSVERHRYIVVRGDRSGRPGLLLSLSSTRTDLCGRRPLWLRAIVHRLFAVRRPPQSTSFKWDYRSLNKAWLHCGLPTHIYLNAITALGRRVM